MKYNISGMSLNGKCEYVASGVEANSAFEAEEAFRFAVLEDVVKGHDVTPRGIPFLVDPRTIEIEEAKDGNQ